MATPSLISSNDIYISFFSPRQGVESAPFQDLKFLYKKKEEENVCTALSMITSESSLNPTCYFYSVL